MPLNEADYEDLRAERSAEPRRYSNWDPRDQFREQYRHLHPENLETVETVTSSTTSVQYAGIRPSPGLGPNHANSNGHSNSIHRLETERYNARLERHPTALERISTHRSQHYGTVGSARPSKSKESLPKFGGGKPYPPVLPEQEEYVVEFDGHNDPMHAQNWPMWKKLYVSAVIIFDSFSATFASSVFSPAAVGLESTFGIGLEVATLGTSLFVLGYAFGPIVWAPMSELYGRRLPIVIAAFGFSVFAIAVAVAKDIQTVLICRFFGGIFGSCPLTVVAAIFADMYDNEVRGLAIATFSATVIMGPFSAPFIGGFITESYLGWRWTEYISFFMGVVSFLLALLFLPETYAPVILIRKASELRRRTKNWGIHAKQEEIEIDLRELLVKNISRPLRILFTEPIVLFVTIYMSFIYGLLYLFLTAYALVFQGVYGMNAGVSGLPYFALILGVLIGFAAIVFMNPGYVRKLKANDNIPVPEWRLPLVMAGGIFFAAGLFWFGWTGYTNKIHWIVPTISGILTGFGIYTVFLQLLNYIVDAYLMFAASAIAGNTFMRSLFGAIFPLFATYMFNGIGINYGITLIGAIAVVMIPLPFVFFFYGKKIRAKSTFAPAPDIEQDKKRDEEQGMGTGGLGTRAEEEKISDSGERRY